MYGPSAAWWHGLLAEPPDQCWLTVSTGRTPDRMEGIRTRRRNVPAADVVRSRGLRVTTVPLTILETAVLVPEGSVFVDRALMQGTDLHELERTHRRNLGRAGSARCAEYLRAAADGSAQAAERMLHQVLRRARVRGWRTSTGVRGYRVAATFEAARVLVDTDGWRFRRGPDHAGRVARREQTLQEAGWVVLRFDWHDLKYRPDDVVAAILAAVSARTG